MRLTTCRFLAQVNSTSETNFYKQMSTSSGKSASEIGMYNEAIKALVKPSTKIPSTEMPILNVPSPISETGNFDRN
jgi:hypothetical protein